MLNWVLQALKSLFGVQLRPEEDFLRLQADHAQLESKLNTTEAMVSQLRGQLRDQDTRLTNLLAEHEQRWSRRLRDKQQSLDQLQALHQQLTAELDRQTLEQLRENQALLNQINWLSGTIAHDFRAPLRAIDAYSFFLADDLGPEVPQAATQSLSEIRRNGQRMGVLIDGLLDYLRMSVCPMNLQTHDLAETLNQTINLHCPDSAPLIHLEAQGLFRFDKELVIRLLKELLDNAIKFSAKVENPTIRVRLVSPTELEITDNGVGFDVAFEAQKFQLFHRMHGNDEYPGEGIGLAVAERIAGRHHWTLGLNRVGNLTVASIRMA
ncbi:MAG: sensor histidine kinase [Limnobacter sp.]|uniref:sensor histidine kinase n=1 Tax=Limnobacter sp. TaxID=2003368 RepID=UPI003919F03D